MADGGTDALVMFLGYTPDLDPTIPGVMTECAAIVPSLRGMRGAPTPASTSLPALAAQCKGAAAVLLRNDTTRMFAGTLANLYEAGSSSWTDRTPSGASQTLNGLGTSEHWRFAQFQDTTLATAKTEVPVFLAGGATFAKVTTTAPKCGIIETVNNFVICFDVNDQAGIYDSLDRPDGWWCAGKGNYTSWTPSITTEAATGTLTSTGGKITAGRRFGYQIIAYKRTSMYVGTYVGQPQIWDFQLLPGNIGALSHEAVVNIGTDVEPRHVFMGADNFYSFDGGRPEPIGDELRKTVFGQMNMSFYYAAKALHDTRNKLIYFYYASTNSNMPDKCVVYNYLTKKWGKDDRQIQAVIDYIAAGLTYDDLGGTYSTYADTPSTEYDATFASAGVPAPAIFNTSHTIKTLSGAAGDSSIITGDYGSDTYFSTLSRVRPRFIEAPASSTLTNAYRNVLSDSLVNDSSQSLSSGRYDVFRSARWHRLNFAMSGDHEESGFTVDIIPDGEE